MSLGGIFVLLFLLVSVIVFIFATVKAAATWGALHTTLLWTIFTECWILLFAAAGVQENRVKYAKQAFQQTEQLEAAEARTQSLTWGTFQAGNDDLDAVVPAKGALRRLTSDRGRVWRNVTFLQGNDQGFQLELAAADLGGNLDVDQPADDASPTSESLPVDQVVYGFSEDTNQDGRPIPKFYLGEFTVVQSQDGAVTIEPTLPLTPPQKQQIQSGEAGSWTFYELLPLDSHLAFAAPGSESNEEATFGRMDEEVLGELFASVPTEGGRQTALIDSYKFDGQKAKPQDPEASIWALVNILKPESFDVDSQENANATERGYFDASGRSIDIRLKREEVSEKGSVQLTPDMKDELILLKEPVARSLVDKGSAEISKRVYVRPLNDYEQSFNNHAIRMKDVAERIELYQRETQLLADANQEGQNLISLEQVENGKLASDLQNYSKETSVLNEAVSQLQTQLSQLRSELSSLYARIQASVQ
ncbi:MAG: hypothetical protein AB8B50_12185 [Pirellulaceae bacterium]